MFVVVCVYVSLFVCVLKYLKVFLFYFKVERLLDPLLLKQCVK